VAREEGKEKDFITMLLNKKEMSSASVCRHGRLITIKSNVGEKLKGERGGQKI